MLASPSAIKVPPPPSAGSAEAQRDRAELATLSHDPSPADLATVHRFGDYPPTRPWTMLNEELVSEQVKDPPLASRGYALVAVAMNDAVVSAWYWKYQYRRPAPPGRAVVPASADPSYPSEHAAIAGAASRVLAYLFPQRSRQSWDQIAEQAGRSRIVNGLNYPSDVDAGLALGRAVADQVIAHADTDGWNRVWGGSRPTGPGTWQPPPGVPAQAAPPVEPLAGTWRPWLAASAALRAPPPPAYASSAYLAEAQNVLETGRHLTDAEKGIARRWAAGSGTPLPPGLWQNIALDELSRHPLSTQRAAQLVAEVSVAMADAGLACWRVKYEYWTARPVNAIHDLGLDPHWTPLLNTPFFPSYPSGHSTYSAASAEVLAAAFPRDAVRLRAMASEAGRSRIYGGIHFPSDNTTGLALGASIGKLVVSTVGIVALSRS